MRVPTGAFVARRNGKVFVTGNSGFPKSHDVSKAIDKAAGAERELVGVAANSANRSANIPGSMAGDWKAEPTRSVTAPATPLAAQWSGYGTALKPAYEPIVLAMNPLDGTFARNAEAHGVAGINVDGCRVGTGNGDYSHPGNDNRHQTDTCYGHSETEGRQSPPHTQGRFPANLLHDGSDEVLACFGTAARFFYVAKASRAERDAGLDGLATPGGTYAGGNGRKARRINGGDEWEYIDEPPAPRRNIHPCVKPLALCEYLARLILPPERDTPRRLLVPFAGSGSEAIGALRAGWDAVDGIELDAAHADVARARIAHEQKAAGPLFAETTV